MNPAGKLGAQRRSARQQRSRKEPAQGRMHTQMVRKVDQAHIVEQRLPCNGQKQYDSDKR